MSFKLFTSWTLMTYTVILNQWTVKLILNDLLLVFYFTLNTRFIIIFILLIKILYTEQWTSLIYI